MNAIKPTMTASSSTATRTKQQDDPILRACLRKKYIQETVILANKKLETWSRSSSPPIERRKSAVKLNVSRNASSGVKQITWKLPNVPVAARKINRDKPPNARRRIRKLTPEEREALYQQRPDLRPTKKNPSLEAEADVIDGATESRGAFSATRAIGSFFGTAVTALHEYAYGGASDSSDDESDDSSQGSESSESYASESNSEKSDNESTSSDLELSPLRRTKLRPFEANPTADIESSMSSTLRVREEPLQSDPDQSRQNTPVHGELTNQPTGLNGTPTSFSHRQAVQWNQPVRTSKSKGPLLRNDEPTLGAKPYSQNATSAHHKNSFISKPTDRYFSQPVKIVPVEHSPQAAQPVATPSEGRRRRRREIKKQKSIGEIVSKFVNDNESIEPSTAVSLPSKEACQMQSAEVLMDLVTSEPSTAHSSGALTKETMMLSTLSKKSPRRRRIRAAPSSKHAPTTKDAAENISLSNADILESLEAHEQAGTSKSHSSDKSRGSTITENPRKIHTNRKAFTVLSKHAESSLSPAMSPHHRRTGSGTGHEQQQILSLSPPKNNDENASIGNNTTSSFGKARESDKRGPVALRSREFRLARLTMTGSSTSARVAESKLED